MISYVPGIKLRLADHDLIVIRVDWSGDRTNPFSDWGMTAEILTPEFELIEFFGQPVLHIDFADMFETDTAMITDVQNNSIDHETVVLTIAGNGPVQRIWTRTGNE